MASNGGKGSAAADARVDDVMLTDFVRISPENKKIPPPGPTQPACIVVEGTDGGFLGLVPGERLWRQPDRDPADLLEPGPVICAPGSVLPDVLQQISQQADKTSGFLAVVENNQIIGVLDPAQLLRLALHTGSTEEMSNARYERAQMDHFLQIVVHDIRSPLAIIKLCAEYLLTEDAATSGLSGETTSFIERIDRNAERASKLAGELLDGFSLDAGQSLDFSPVKVRSWLMGIVDNLQVRAEERSLKLVLEDGGDTLQVPMDADRLTQAVENLVNNAIKFSPEGKKIYLGVEKVAGRDGKSLVCIGVRDEGPGIAGADLDSIFDQYHQLDTGAAKKLGIGLGLCIAQKFVTRHHGFIEVESTPGQGATFKILIPELPETAGVAEEERRRARILVVDDDDSIRALLLQELTEEGFEVVVAANGEEALTLFHSGKPDVVISDISMPVMDGFELLNAIKEEDASIPVILCSGFYPNLSEQMARSIFKADHLLEKPFRLGAVSGIVEAQLSQRES